MWYFVLFKNRDAFQTLGVPESSSSIIVVLLIIIAGLLVVIAGLLMAVLRRLSAKPGAKAEDLTVAPSRELEQFAGGPPAEGAFECFLNEDPNRRLLPKKEQAAAYRNWRKEKGLNWSACAGS